MALDRIKIMCCCFFWLALIKPLKSVPPPQCDHYGICKPNYPFLPSAPGIQPPCAKPGNTFCEKIEHYPTQLIRYLLDKYGYDYGTLLSDESRDNFNNRRPVMYGPPPRPAHPYGPPRVHHLPYIGPLQFIGNSSGRGYPDRRYRLPEQYLTATPYLYTTLLQPATHYNPDDWWERQASILFRNRHQNFGF